MKIFSGHSNKLLAEKIAQELGYDVSPLEIHIFPDTERRVRVLDSVVNEDTIIVQPTNAPVNLNYMELFFIVDALKRSGAKSVTAIVPYLGYQRQDHVFRSGEAVSLEVVVKTLQASGLDRILVYDLHSIKSKEVFNIPVIHLSALPLFAKTIQSLCQDASDCVLVSPDMGGIRRIKIISELLGMPFVTVNKNRDLATGSISSTEFEGEVKKKAFIVDDMASSGQTLAEAAKLLKENGAEEVYALVTHAVFSKDAPSLLQTSSIEKVYTTDSVLVPKEKMFDKLEILSISKEIAEKLTSS